MKKMWDGRFTKATDKLVDDFNSSIFFDRRMFREDIQGSLAHVAMLADCGILTTSEAKVISDGLQSVLADLESGRVEIDLGAEDIHMFVEALLTERVGEVGKKLHTARSRNDQVALDVRLHLRREIDEIRGLLAELMKTLLDQAEANKGVIVPGYTHLQPAQPILFAHHLLAYFEMFMRDAERLADCRKRVDVSPLGAGALAGVTFPVDRFNTARRLAMGGVAANSLDAVSDRDFALEFAAHASILMMHLSRFSEEIILWSSAQYGFVELDDSFSTGSSIMPQKKNPDVAELVRGKTGRVYGDLMTLLTVMKGLPLAYNKDMQEDKEPLFDAIDTLKVCLPVFGGMLATLKVRADRMHEATAKGYLNATDAADYLAKRGIPFREAHAIVGKVVRAALERGIGLEEFTADEWRGFSAHFDADILQVVQVRECVAARDMFGGTAPARVEAALAEARRRIGGLLSR